MRLSHVCAVCLLLVCRSAFGQELKVYFGNLHSHTSLSDGTGMPEEAYLHARHSAGLDFLAITEHNHAQAGKIQNDPQLYSGTVSSSLIETAKRHTVDNEFVAIYGQEFSTISSGNHANVFEVGEVIDEDDVPVGAWNKLLLNWLPAHLDSLGNPALILLNHPATSDSPNSREYGIDDFGSFEEWRTKLDAHAQLINIINGPSHSGTNPGRPSESEFRRYLNMGLHVAPTADQDNHRPNWGSVASTRTGVITTSLTKANILAALRNRHVYATEDRNLKLIGKVNGKLMGTRFQGAEVPPPGNELAISVEIKDDNEPNALYTIDVFADTVGGSADADVIEQFEATGNGTVELPGIRYQGGNQYFFLRLSQTDDDGVEVDRAWLAPVWFEPASEAAPQESLVTLRVNVLTEKATITNVGAGDVNLLGWTLVSVSGNQRFEFESDLVLAPGKFVVVTSGPNPRHDPPRFVRWIAEPIWNNSGDPGELLDPEGNVAATSD